MTVVLSRLRAVVLLALLTVVMGARPLLAQVVTTDPALPGPTDPVTITFHADRGTMGLKGYTGSIYAHTGVITDKSTQPSDWKYVKTAWGQDTPETKLTRIAPDTYTLTIANPRAYYGVPTTDRIVKLAFVFRNEGPAPTKTGKDTGDKDIFVDIYDSGVSLRFTQPTVGALSPLIVERNQPFTVTVASSSTTGAITSLRLLVDGVVQQTVSNTETLSATLSLPTAGRRIIRAEATDASGATGVAEFAATVNPAPVYTPIPVGLKDGITYDPADPTRATLSLYAPKKKFVYVIGDFNNWEVQPAYFMAKDSVRADSVRYWLTLTGLTPGTEYAFQYLVDGTIRMGDPYSEKILDPSNDPYISAATYPNLKPYPSGKTLYPVTVLQTARPAFGWHDAGFRRPAQKDLVVYELLVRDFTAAKNYQTLVDTLDYIQRLGINTIELMPVAEFEGNLSWGYNPMFHMALDKAYGTPQSFKRFVDACHQRGIAVVLDVVYNHATNQSPLIRLYNTDGAYGGPTAENIYTNLSAPHPYGVFVDLNHESTATRYWLDRVNAYWLTEYHIDGYRFDLAKGFTQRQSTESTAANYDLSRVNTLQRMASKIWDVDPTAYVILELFTENREEQALTGYGIGAGRPGMMVWGNLNNAYNQTTMGYTSQSDFSGGFWRNRSFAAPNLVTYMESHDEERLMYKNLTFGNSNPNTGYTPKDLATALEREKAAGALFLLQPGPKMIWQFGELGYDFSIDYNGRVGEKPIRWDYLTDPKRRALYDTWSKLLSLRKQNPVFTDTQTTASFSVSSDLKRITLTNPSANAVVMGNFGVTTYTTAVTFPSTGVWYDAMSDTSFTVGGGGSVTITFAPGSYHVFMSARPVAVEPDAPASTPLTFRLLPAAPNPVNPTTAISYQLSAVSNVRLDVFDALGRRIKTLVDESKPAGSYRATFDASGLPSGLYLARLTATGTDGRAQTAVTRLTLLR